MATIAAGLKFLRKMPKWNVTDREIASLIALRTRLKAEAADRR